MNHFQLVINHPVHDLLNYYNYFFTYWHLNHNMTIIIVLKANQYKKILIILYRKISINWQITILQTILFPKIHWLLNNPYMNNWTFSRKLFSLKIFARWIGRAPVTHFQLIERSNGCVVFIDRMIYLGHKSVQFPLLETII